MNKTPKQKEAIETLGKHLCVDAAAGSGKTMVLVERIIHILEGKHAKLDEIVAITFTDAAAAEMKERLRAACRDRAPKDDSEKMSYWRDMERRIDSARITTIHGFCSTLIRENALALGIDPDFAVLSEAEAILLRNEVVKDTVHRLFEAEDAAARNVGVEHGVDRLVRAFAGLLNQGEVIDRLCEEFTFDDPNVLCARWKEVVEGKTRERLEAFGASAQLKQYAKELRSFDGMCSKPEDAREVSRVALLDACEKMIKAESVGRAFERLCAALEQPIRGTRKTNWSSSEEYDALKEVMEELKKEAKEYAPIPFDDQVETQAARLTCDFFATFNAVQHDYDEAKRLKTSLDFGDLIRLAAKTLRDRDEVCRRTAQGIKYLLIDEFQDTDATQLDIAKALQNIGGKYGAELFVVGDAKQSIYNFRGAEVEVFRSARETSDDIIPLEKNFRSAPGVLSFINDFFSRSVLLTAVEPEYSPLLAHRAPASEQCIEFLIPELVEGADADEYRRMEAELIAERVIAMCDDTHGEDVYDRKREEYRRAQFGDVALLFRAASSMYLYEEALRRRGVPFTVVAGSGFFERQEIADFRNLLVTAIDPWNEVALLGVLRSPLAGLSDESIMLLCGQAGLAEAFWSAGSLENAEQCERLEAARKFLATLRARTELPLPTFLRYALAESSYEAILLAGRHGPSRAGNLRKLIDLAETFSGTSGATLGAFVRYLDEVGAHEIREGEAVVHAANNDSVTLMSVHKAKGLEFPIVVVADAARAPGGGRKDTPFRLHRRLGLTTDVVGADGERCKPAMATLIGRAEKDEERAEQARVLYVALTRARDRLLIGGAPAGKIRGSWLHAMNDVFEMFEKGDNKTVPGEGWSARVRRAQGSAQIPKTPKRATATIAHEPLMAQTAPWTPSAAYQSRASISALLDRMGEGEDGIKYERRSAGTGHALYLGSVVHSLFESWDVMMEDSAPVERVLRATSPPLALRASLRDHLTRAEDLFRGSALYARMRKAGPIQREAPFWLSVGGAWVSGKLDALLADGTIIDYKTGKRRAEQHARYEQQLRLYAAAVSELCAIESPTAILYYVDSAEEVAVDVSKAKVDETLALAAEALQGAAR